MKEFSVFNYFKEKYKLIPSTLYLKNEKIPKENLDNFLNKFYLVYTKKEVIDNKIVEIERLVEYDPNGILIYVKNSVDIFIYTTSDRLNVAEFALYNLIKQNK
jgi:hypothetical protein